jgi:hypothetical protein
MLRTDESLGEADAGRVRVLRQPPGSGGRTRQSIAGAFQWFGV